MERKKRTQTVSSGSDKGATGNNDSLRARAAKIVNAKLDATMKKRQKEIDVKAKFIFEHLKKELLRGSAFASTSALYDKILEAADNEQQEVVGIASITTSDTIFEDDEEEKLTDRELVLLKDKLTALVEADEMAKNIRTFCKQEELKAGISINTGFKVNAIWFHLKFVVYGW